ACGAVAWKVHRRAHPRITAAVPIFVAPAPQPAPHFAVPPPGDPYPRPDLIPADKRAFVVDAVLVAEPRTMPDCGTFVADSLMLFHPVRSNGADLRVLVPCAEMTRPQFSRDAGDAG